MTNPTLEIISDSEADIVRGASRYKLIGGRAAQIIWAYRHCLEHPGTGEQDAALFLWGLGEGISHGALVVAENVLKRRWDDPTTLDEN
jgi:hypothetical protein